MVLRYAFIAALVAAPAFARAADKPPIVVRFVGEAPSVGDCGPARFVVDATATPSDEGGYEVSGWLGSFPPLNDHGEVTGRCVDRSCELKADIEGHDMVLSGAILGAKGPVDGRFEIVGDVAESMATKGTARFTLVEGAIPELGILVQPDAVDSRALDELLIWHEINPVFGDDTPHPIDDSGREHIASWQQANERPINGLLFKAELELMTAQREAAQKVAGWTPLGGPDLGWAGGYPAVLLPKASRKGSEQRFESADGRASLVIAIDPPLTEDDFDALSDRLHGEAGATADRDTLNYVRTGSDIAFSYKQHGAITSVVYYGRKSGLVKLVYTYPEDDNRLAAVETPITGSLRASDDVRPAP